MWTDGQDAACFGLGAPIAQGASGAQVLESGLPLLILPARVGQGNGVSVRAGHGGGGGIDGKVVEGEAARDGRPQGGGFEEQSVPLRLEGVTGLACGVGGVTEYVAAARICGGMLGRPFADGYMPANISAGNSAPRCSARNANTLPTGINSRHSSHTSGPTVSPAHSPITMKRVWPHRPRGGARTPRSS